MPRAVEQVKCPVPQVDDSALAQEPWQRAKTATILVFWQQKLADRVTEKTAASWALRVVSLLAPGCGRGGFALYG
ncbi:MAG: hypothetical protein H6661_04380 [Ardenticatenaceae bacterium]|nr:hypothetical protein [Ardenticatenaceae bacterium]